MKTEPIKGKMPILVGLLIIVLALMWFAGRCSISHKGSIAEVYCRPGGDTVAVAIEMSPMTYTFSGDSAAGFEYEVMKAIARRHNLPVVFHPFAPLEYAFDGLHKGDFDMVIASVPSTKKISDVFLLTDDIYLDRQVLVTRKDTTADSTATKIPAQMRLLDDTVWVAEASPAISRLRNLSHEMGDTIYIESKPGLTSEHLVILAATGEIKQAVVNEAVARRLADQYPDLDISTPISLNQFQPWMLNKDKTALRDSLNVWIAEFKQTPEYKRLIDKYLR